VNKEIRICILITNSFQFSMIKNTHYWLGNCHNPFLGHSQIFFLFLKKKTARCRFERHCTTFSPLQMQRQGRRRFLKSFSRSPSPFLFPPTCHQNPDTSHSPYPATINTTHALQITGHLAL